MTRSSFTVRLAAGVFGGASGALAFGLIMLSTFILQGPSLDGRGLAPVLGALTGSEDPLILWELHMLIGATFGVIYALALRPRRGARALGFGLAYGFLLWGVAGQLVARAVLDVPLALDGMAYYSLAGHLLYGGVLGFVVGHSQSAILSVAGGRSEDATRN